MSDTDPIRALAARRQAPTYRLPEYVRPRFDTAPEVNLYALTPGGGRGDDRTPADHFDRHLSDQLNGSYGA